MAVSKQTINLLADLTTPLTRTGALPKSERQAVLQLLNAHTPEAEARRGGSKARGLTVKQACDALNVSRSTVSRMLKTGELRGHYLRPGSPRTLRISPESVEAVLSGSVEDSK